MKKSVRRILSLVLAIALICALTTVSFAATYADVEEAYKFCFVTGSAEIDRYSTNIAMTAEVYADIYFSGNMRNDSTFYSYGHSGEDDYFSFYYVEPISGNDTAYSRTISYTEYDIECMRDTEASFYVVVDTPAGSFVFNPTPLRVSYPHSAH